MVNLKLNKKTPFNQEKVTTRIADLTTTLEDFTQAVCDNNLDESDSKEASKDIISLLHELGRDMKEVKADMHEMRDDIKTIDGKLNGQIQRIDNIGAYIVEAKNKSDQQEKVNTNFLKRIEYSEASIKKKQAVLTTDAIDTSKINYRMDSLALLALYGLSEGIVALINVSRFGLKKNTVLVTFPTYSAKIILYKVLKDWKNSNAASNAPKIYMNDLLTTNKLELFKKVRALKEEGKLADAFSFKDDVYIKQQKTGDRKLIRSHEDIVNLKL